jgi:hypothetical protein
MQYEIVETEVFKKSLKKTLKKYPKSLSDIESKVKEIIKTLPGDKCTLYSPHEVKKVRFELRAYRIGKRRGLRLLYLVLTGKKKLVPVYIYKKGKPKTEKEVEKEATKNILAIFKEIAAKK